MIVKESEVSNYWCPYRTDQDNDRCIGPGCMCWKQLFIKDDLAYGTCGLINDDRKQVKIKTG